MLLSFSVTNFKSFREEQVLDLTASALQPAFSWLENAAVPVGKEESALRVKAIYGANASGKSNLITALQTFVGVSLFSATNKALILSVTSYGFDLAVSGAPSKFEITFAVEGKHYEYGILMDYERIHKEWLYDTTIRKAEVYVRDGMKVKLNDKYFRNNDSVKLLTQSENQLFRVDSTFLSALSLFPQQNASLAAIRFFSDILVIKDVEDVVTEQRAYEMLKEDPNLLKKVESLLRFGDINFDQLFAIDRDAAQQVELDPGLIDQLQRSRGRYSLMATHKVNGSDELVMSWLTEKGESQGTQKMLVLAPYIINIIETGGILIIDEFEAKLHTRLSREIVAMFNSATGNPNNAQFIFATHDTNLLDHKLLRRDQIDFVEKGEDRASVVYSLSDVKGIRKEADFESDYLGGSYGAVPNVTDFNIAILED
jgi:AAA15 family ATPase/GTPase